jgi:hypothetical protein
MRLANGLLVQRLDGEDIVIIDESTGSEIVVPATAVDSMSAALVAVTRDRDSRAVDEALQARHDRPTCSEAHSRRIRFLCGLPKGHPGQHQEIYRWGTA